MLRLALIVLVMALVPGTLGIVGLRERRARFFRAVFGLFLVIAAALFAVGLLAGETLF